MRTPKRLYAQQRLIYQPELLTCPHCGALLVMGNYLAWNKTVQKLDRGLSVASRPGRCPNETCAGSRLRLLSAEAQSIALPHSTYGYDVLGRIGWWRSQHHATYRETHAEWASHVRISVAHVSYLYQQVYLPLLACHERPPRDRLAQECGVTDSKREVKQAHRKLSKTTKRGRKRLFNAAIHALRLRVERTFAWENKFKRLWLRFERIQQRHYGMKLMAYTLINLRAFCGV